MVKDTQGQVWATVENFNNMVIVKKIKGNTMHTAQKLQNGLITVPQIMPRWRVK